MPNPKHKHSRARRDKRRTQKLRVTPPGMSVCPQCHELKLPHYTCLNCGTYKGKAVIQVEEVKTARPARIRYSSEAHSKRSGVQRAVAVCARCENCPTALSSRRISYDCKGQGYSRTSSPLVRMSLL